MRAASVGKYLTDTIGTDVGGFIPTLVDAVPHNEDGVGGGHLYMPWWLDNTKLDFPRGYHIEVWGGRGMPSYGFMGGIESFRRRRRVRGGSSSRQYRQYYGTTIGFSGRGEMIPNDDTYCEIDPRTVDRWGIPVLRFHWKWTRSREASRSSTCRSTFRALLDEMGGKLLRAQMPERRRTAMASPPADRIIHEAGRRAHGKRSDDSVPQLALPGLGRARTSS